MGVHLLNISRQREPALGEHSTLEGGLMNPRLSLQGRMSLDGWNNPDTRIGPAPSPRGHGRRSSLYRNQTSTLFNAFDEHEDPEAVGLQQLREEDESDDEDHADERTRLNKTALPPMNGNGRQSGSRSQSHSPIPNRSASTDVRIALP